MTKDQFIDRMMGCMVFGLDEKQADALIAQGKDTCDYFEKAVLAAEYELFKSCPVEVTIDQWAYNHPKVVKELYFATELHNE
jgi:hypothetical protein